MEHGDKMGTTCNVYFLYYLFYFCKCCLYLTGSQQKVVWECYMIVVYCILVVCIIAIFTVDFYRGY